MGSSFFLVLKKTEFSDFLLFQVIGALDHYSSYFFGKQSLYLACLYTESVKFSSIMPPWTISGPFMHVQLKSQARNLKKNMLPLTAY